MDRDTEPQFSAGSHTYSNIYASGNSRQHNGNVINDYRHATVTILQDGIVRSKKRKRDPDDDPQGPQAAPGDDLDHAAKKLGALSSAIREQRSGKPARKIIKRVQTLLSCLLSNDTKSDSGAQLDPQTKQRLKDLKRRLRGLTVALVNSPPPRRLPSEGAAIQRRNDIVRIRDWNLSFEASELQLLAEEGLIVHTLLVLRLEPSAGRRGTPISLCFGERSNMYETTILHPTIFAYRNVPSSSPVFKLIERDDVEGLKELLISQQATTRDCDEWNRSLLYYACYYMSLSCCKLLIDSGADLDRRNRFMLAGTDPELHPDRTALDAYPLRAAIGDDRYVPCGETDRDFQYRAMLLDAGADPLAGSEDGIDVFEATSLYDAIEYGVLEIVEILLQKGSWSFDIRSLRYRGLSLWLHACKMAKNVEILSSLLAAYESAGKSWSKSSTCCGWSHGGGNVYRTDWNVAENDESGWNCLFYCVFFARSPDSSASLERLLFLVTLEVDIFAQEFTDGVTIFEMADEPNEVGSYQQDLWYCALKRAGYQVDDDPRVPARKPQYLAMYTPMHYHALQHLDSWASNADMCSQLAQVYASTPMTAREASQMIRLNRMRRRKGMHELWFTDPRTDEERECGRDSYDEEVGAEDSDDGIYSSESSEDEEEGESEFEQEMAMSSNGRIDDVTDDMEYAELCGDQSAVESEDVESVDSDSIG